ncbi:MAG: allophanate hydrolase, partial [Alteromonas sp.]|nr:allophanate hydrolase [Alteromonas sp.]
MQPFGTIRAVQTAGEDGVIFYTSGADLAAQNQAITALNQALMAHRPHWLTELVPSYDSLMLVFNMSEVDYHGVYQFVKQLPITDTNSQTPSTLHRLP